MKQENDPYLPGENIIFRACLRSDYVKFILSFILTFPALFSLAQNTDTASRQVPAITAFIEGYNGKDTIDIDAVRAGFRLKLSDTSFTIKQYTACWDDEEGDINCISVLGDHVIPDRPNIRKPHASSILTFDNILATKKGLEYKVRSFLMHTHDVNKKYPTLKNPRICHNKKQQLTCYNDGTYAFYFDKNIFSGFQTVDSLVRYNEKEKLFLIKNTSPATPADSIVSIQFNKGALIFKSGNFEKRMDTITTGVLDLGGYKIQLGGHRYTDTVRFKAGSKKFLIEISALHKRKTWTIIERHGASLFYISTDYKRNRPEHISIQDERLRHGMTIGTRFKTHRRTWHLKSSFVDEWEEGEHRVIGDIQPKPSYYYSYNRFGKLRKKRTSGAINYCDCR